MNHRCSASVVVLLLGRAAAQTLSVRQRAPHETCTPSPDNPEGVCVLDTPTSDHSLLQTGAYDYKKKVQMKKKTHFSQIKDKKEQTKKPTPLKSVWRSDAAAVGTAFEHVHNLLDRHEKLHQRMHGRQLDRSIKAFHNTVSKSLKELREKSESLIEIATAAAADNSTEKHKALHQALRELKAPSMKMKAGLDHLEREVSKDERIKRAARLNAQNGTIIDQAALAHNRTSRRPKRYNASLLMIKGEPLVGGRPRKAPQRIPHNATGPIRNATGQIQHNATGLIQQNATRRAPPEGRHGKAPRRKTKQATMLYNHAREHGTITHHGRKASPTRNASRHNVTTLVHRADHASNATRGGPTKNASSTRKQVKAHKPAAKTE